jgi:hypothetical protein
MTATMQPSASAIGVTRQLLADPALTQRSPGEEFAWAVARESGGADVTLTMQAHLTSAFPLFTTRPRYTVRHLLKVATITEGTLAYVREAPNGRSQSGSSYADTPESGFLASVESGRLTDLSLAVPVPNKLLEQPALLAAYVDYRVLVRMGVVENESLLHGTADGVIGGLLNLPEMRLATRQGDLTEALTEAAAQVEETGGSCDGITVHPRIYWRLVRDGSLGRLAEAGIRVARTRMMPRDQALLGDYRAAVTLLDPGVSSLTLARKAAPDGADLIVASTRIGLAVHLPQHFLLLSGVQS